LILAGIVAVGVSIQLAPLGQPALSLDDRVVFARLLTAVLILLVASGSALAPTLFVGLVALAVLGLTTFETLYAGRPAPG
jgi:hypothetical protein